MINYYISILSKVSNHFYPMAMGLKNQKNKILTKSQHYKQDYLQVFILYNYNINSNIEISFLFSS